jgi:3-oxoacyl-[acyl-carrier-protein] synthase III
MPVYINDVAAFLPNEPVDNEHIEEVLGRIHDIPSRVKSRILKNNGIQKRYYAIDRKTGKINFNNAQLTAEAIRLLKPTKDFSINQIQCLCCGTSIADVMAPGHGLMVQGELKIPPCEVISTSGICLSGITALKAAYMNVALELSDNAVATGSEHASSLIRSYFFEHLQGDSRYANHPILNFESDFLRFMLSDAAGAVYLSREKSKANISLRVDWIEHISYAGEMETCMYAGGTKNDDGTITGWKELESLEDALKKNHFALKQDVSILNQEMIKVSVDKALARAIKKRNLKADDFDWFLPHYSSEYFRDKVYDAMVGIDFRIPYEKWFSNLIYKGNTGAASIYVMLEEIFHSGKLKEGEKILCFIPESGRFSVGYMQLSVV